MENTPKKKKSTVYPWEKSELQFIENQIKSNTNTTADNILEKFPIIDGKPVPNLNQVIYRMNQINMNKLPAGKKLSLGNPMPLQATPIPSPTGFFYIPSLAQFIYPRSFCYSERKSLEKVSKGREPTHTDYHSHPTNSRYPEPKRVIFLLGVPIRWILAGDLPLN